MSGTPRCTVEPLPDHQASFLIEGVEKLRWHYGPQYPRPFFYPLAGPSGASLTRMGHPGADNHDHHRSVWFAHHKVLGINFWGDNTKARIRQKHWLAYEDGDDEAIFATLLGWYDGHDPQELLEQELIVAVRPDGIGTPRGTFVELQTRFIPKAESLEFGRTNFGFLAVRVAKSISEHFGGGRLTDAEGRTGEPAIFGKRAAWMDYSGPVQPPRQSLSQPQPKTVGEGTTYFDHPSNPGHPTHWHVREDGWMGASVCMKQARTTTQKSPLTVRYLLHAHAGNYDADRAMKVAGEFAKQPGLEVVQASGVKHRQRIARRVSGD